MKMLGRSAAASLAVVAVLGATTAPEATATAAVPQVVATILATASGHITSIGNYYFCTTAACKKAHTTNAKASLKALEALVNESASASALTTSTRYSATLKLFTTDVNSMFTNYRTYTTSTSTDAQSEAIGGLFYELANLRTDVAQLQALKKGTALTFAAWAYGVSAILYTMQIDQGAVTASNSTASVAEYANAALEGEAASLTVHANGPNAAFNASLVRFAKNQTSVSVNENDYLTGVKGQLSEKQVANLNVTVGTEFSAIAKNLSALAKKK